MKYMGSKSKIVDEIAPIIQHRIDQFGAEIYIEPFCGGCNVIDKIKAPKKWGGDNNPYLIALWEHLQETSTLPDKITKEEYVEARLSYRSKDGKCEPWFIGAAGLLASYNGKFFGGYAGIGYEGKRVRDYYRESRDNVLNQINSSDFLTNTTFAYSDYASLIPTVEEKEKTNKIVIYCDPPYRNTTKYGHITKFDYDLFWDKVREWSQKYPVLVSEMDAPDDFEVVWERDVIRSLNAKKRTKSNERLCQWKKM